MQITTISIQAKNREFKISAIYCPPRYIPTKEDYTNLFRILGNYFIIGSDFNAKHAHWSLRLITLKGRELLQAGQKYKCEFLSIGSLLRYY